SWSVPLYALRSLASPFSCWFVAAPTTPPSTLSLHDALPIYCRHPRDVRGKRHLASAGQGLWRADRCGGGARDRGRAPAAALRRRSEEHTSELQSRENLVCRLLLEKQNNHVAAAGPRDVGGAA